MYIVIHIGSDHINQRVGLHNCLSHYAELSDAAARHKYVQSVVVHSNAVGRPKDYLGKLFALATKEQAE